MSGLSDYPFEIFASVKLFQIYSQQSNPITRHSARLFTVIDLENYCLDYKFKPPPADQTPCHSWFTGGIICGPHWGSFAVRNRYHLQPIYILGIISGRGSCGPFWRSFPVWGSFAVRDNLAVHFGDIDHFRSGIIYLLCCTSDVCCTTLMYGFQNQYTAISKNVVKRKAIIT